MAPRSKVSKYLKRSVELGAKGANRISPRSVTTAAWVRLKCQYGCDGFGLGLMCPPHSPTPETTAQVLAFYRAAILIHGDDHVDVSEVAVKLEREACGIDVFQTARNNGFPIKVVSGPRDKQNYYALVLLE